jgi:hypothetical protein
MGDPGIFAYLGSGYDIIVADSREALLHRLRRLIESDFFRFTPFAGLEVAQFVADETAEANFAEMAASTLAESDPALAIDWVQNASLNPLAKRAAIAAAQKASRESVRDGADSHAAESGLIVWTERTFRQVRLLNSKTVRIKEVPDLFRSMENRRRLGSPGVVMIEAIELVKTFSGYSIAELKSWRAKGILTILLADDIEWDMRNIVAANAFDYVLDNQIAFDTQIRLHRIFTNVYQRRLGGKRAFRDKSASLHFLEERSNSYKRSKFFAFDVRSMVSQRKSADHIQESVYITTCETKQDVEEMVGQIAEDEIARTIVVILADARSEVGPLLRKGFLEILIGPVRLEYFRKVIEMRNLLGVHQPLTDPR